MNEQVASHERNFTIIRIGGKAFAAGLVWRKLTKMEFKKQAKQIGEELKLEMVAIRENKKIRQAGFAPKSKERVRGMYSLAAALCGTLGDDWLGVFAIGEGKYVLIAVKDGGVLPKNDAVGDLESIRKLLSRTNSELSKHAPFMQPNVRKIAPPEFEFYTDHSTLADVLPKKLVKAYKLTPLTWGLTQGQLISVGVSLVLLGGGGYAAKSWWDAKEQAEFERKVAADQAEEAQRKALEAANVPKPWETLPQPSVMLEACKALRGQSPLSLAGWALDRIECAAPGKGSNASTYKRAGQAPLAQFVESATALTGQAPFVVNPDEASLPFDVRLTKAGKTPIARIKVAEHAFASQMQRLSDLAQFTLTPAAVPVADPNVAPDQQPAPLWQTTGFKVTTEVPPELLFSGAAVPGVRITNITTTLAADLGSVSWEVTGEIYGN